MENNYKFYVSVGNILCERPDSLTLSITMSIGELVQLIILIFLSGLLLHSSLLYIGFNVLLTASSLYHVGHCLFTCRQ